MKKIDILQLKNSVVCLGFFDGMHLGHQKILNIVNEIAINYHLDSVAITFSSSLLKKFKMKDLINTYDEKIKCLALFNINYYLTINLKNKLYKLNALEFLKYLENILKCKYLVCGKDMSFGSDLKGNVNFIKQNSNIQVIEVADVLDGNNKISSSYLRLLLKNGNIKKANEFMLLPFTLKGTIVKGKQIGRTINYKTANINVTPNSYCLKHGVYFGKVLVNKRNYYAMINVGLNPTIDDSTNLKIESYILDLDENIYGKVLKISLLYYHREEIKFESLNSLKKQLDNDFLKLKEFAKEN